MSIEIERKFLLKNNDWKLQVTESLPIIQGYISSSNQMTTRVRIMGQHGFITIKGKRTHWSRSEFEYEIPIKDAKAMLLEAQCPSVQKVRHLVNIGDVVWEIDVFKGDNKGLTYAEVELSDETQELQMPLWVGQEVSEDPKYRNSRLASNPYKFWTKE